MWVNYKYEKEQHQDGKRKILYVLSILSKSACGE